MSTVGVVLIGRNEGERLERALRSACKQTDRVVYVDSGSTDGSVAFAESIGVGVVELDMDKPFTAARARNAGADRLLEQYPNTALVQFIDGDCELVEGWLGFAADALAKNAQLAAVCGRLREFHPEASVYNRLIDLEWETPVGPAESCGGIAMFRFTAFNDVGRFDPSVAAGEEPELCMRLRAAGWCIERLDHDMALHDAAITRLSQWMRRSVRTGRGSLDLVTRFGDNGSGFGKIVKRARFWGLYLPMSAVLLGLIPTIGFGIVMLITSDVWASIGFSISIFVLLGLLSLYFAKFSSTFLRACFHGLTHGEAKAYALLDLLGKFAEVRGQVGYLRDKRRGRTTRLIEYKNAPDTTPRSAVEAKHV